MAPEDVIRPFRWDVSRREQLGTLPEVKGDPYPYRDFVYDLIECSARVLAFAGDSDLVFIGRSPESIFDLTSGVVAYTSWEERMSLLNVSLPEGSVNAESAREIRPVLRQLGLHPRSVERQARPIALVDLVDSGATFGELLQVLRTWCRDEDLPWPPVAGRIKIVGITYREKTSPKTQRWQQHAAWVNVLRPASIKNVSMPGELWTYLAAQIPKATRWFPPSRWDDPDVTKPRRDLTARRGLEFAWRLYVLGWQDSTRRHFARALLQQPAAKERWLRSLALEIRR